MNCQTARQTLELEQPSGNGSAAIDAAKRHLLECADCQIVVRDQHEFDQYWGTVCRDIPLPVGLKERLLSLTAKEEAATRVADDIEPGNSPAVKSEPSATIQLANRRFGRRWLISTVAAACCAISVSVWFATRPAPPTMTLDQVIQLALDAKPEIAGTEEFVVFRNGQKVKKPETMIATYLKGEPRQLGDHDVAVYFFRLYDRARRPIECRLLVFPKSSIVETLTATSFQAGLIPAAGVPYRASLWVEKDLAYICYVTGGGDLALTLQPNPV